MILHYISNIFISLLLYGLYSNDLFLFFLFTASFASLLILVHILFIDATFEKKHPFLFKLLIIICSIIITYSFYILAKFLILKIKYIIDYIFKINSSNNSSNKANTGNINFSNKPGPSGDGGPKPGGEGGPNSPIIIESDGEREKRLKKERAKEYRKINADRIKANRKRYNESRKGRETNKK